MRNCWDWDYADTYDEDWFRELEPAVQQRFQEQDIERAAAHNAVIDGGMSNEEFAALCIRQVSENETIREKLRGKKALTAPEQAERDRYIAGEGIYPDQRYDSREVLVAALDNALRSFGGKPRAPEPPPAQSEDDYGSPFAEIDDDPLP
jgi:hypothetical protein